MKATPDSSDALVFECDLEESPEKVWRALTEPALLEAWLTTAGRPVSDSGIDSGGGADPGGRGKELQPPPTLPGTERNRNDRKSTRVGSSEYEILTAEPHHLLRYRWRDRESGVGEPAGREVHSVVTVELAPCPTGGTHLRLTHGEFCLVSIAPVLTAPRIVPITSARRRTPIASCAARACLRRAA
ncbi:MAG TPA: SRPBCC domain-containing protein [Steroidobacteraceae bacterium]|nr:SRPBCC domain-containing protein [Steroidobacteraceae bacterium]